MTALSATIPQKANSARAKTGIENPIAGNTHELIVAVLRGLQPRKTWAKLVDLIGVSDRVAKHRIAGTRQFTIDELRALLQTEAGIQFLGALMADARPRWWREILAYRKAGNARRAAARYARELQEAMEDVAGLDAVVARAEAALAFQDEDFMRPHIDALREAGGIPSRPVVKARR